MSFPGVITGTFPRTLSRGPPGSNLVMLVTEVFSVAPSVDPLFPFTMVIFVKVSSVSRGEGGGERKEKTEDTKNSVLLIQD